MAAPAGRVRRALAVLALCPVVACGSTVPQQGTLPAAGQPGFADGLAPAPAGDGLEVPGTGAASGAAAAGELTSGGDPALPGTVTGGDVSAERGADGAAAPPAAGAPAAPPPPRGSADRSPLRIGLLYVNNDAASGAGVDNGNSFGPRRVLEAFVKASNARGGLAGRPLQPTYFELKSSSSSYASDLQAACARFVEDAKVSLVLSFLGLASDQFDSCLAKAGVAHVNGSYGLGDVTSVSSATTTVSPAALSADRRSKVVLERLAAAGHLTRASRIGVVVEGCPFNERAVERTLLPTAKRLGLNVVQTHTTRCFGGINDLGGLASDAQNAVLRFITEDVDRVIVVSAVEANVLLVFTNAAESQGYRPGYALSSLALANVLKDNVPPRQLQNAKGAGWLPVLDDAAPSLTPTGTAQACARTARDQGVTPTSPVDHYVVFATCDAFALSDAVLQQTRGALGASAFNDGLDAVGGSFRSATVLDGRTDFRGGRRDGPAQGRVFAFNGSCSCFRYAGAPFSI